MVENSAENFSEKKMQHGYWFWTVLLIVISTVELYLVQAWTLDPNWRSGLSITVGPVIRFTLNTLFLSAIVLALPRRMLVVLLGLTFLLYGGLLAYSQYFSQPLSLMTMILNSGELNETLSTSSKMNSLYALMIHLVPWPSAVILSGFILLKSICIFRSANSPMRYWQQLCVSLGILGIYVAALITLNSKDPLISIRGGRTFARLGYVYGYTPVWAAEWVFLNDQALLERAIETGLQTSDQLSPVENPLPQPRNIVIIQIESLDYNVLDFQINGQYITPFLHQLKSQSRFYRIQAIHQLGSADADFVALTGKHPSPDAITYKIPKYPYQNTLPQILKPKGFQAVSFHGNTGSFFNRQSAFQRMEFDEVLFKEELVELYDAKTSSAFLLDEVIFDLSVKKLNESKVPSFHFLITVTSHTPFDYLTHEQKKIFPNSHQASENYFNSIHYVDRCVKAYFEQLPKDTLVVVYSDHAVGLNWKGFHSDKTHGKEYIPLYIYSTEENLALTQSTRDSSIALDGSLTLLDLITYLKKEFRE